MKTIYCTVLNEAFVPRALALQRSIAAHSPHAVFAFYCVDDAAVALLRSLTPQNSRIIAPVEFETAALRAIKATVKLNEYCWTCKPVALHHALKSDRGLDWAVWLDADMFAFGDLDSALMAEPDADVALTPHRFTSEFAGLELVVGRFNAGYVAFRNSDAGLAALEWWMQRCLEGCPAKPFDGRYADQKYLDDVPKLFTHAVELSPQSVNAAPWNIFGQAVEARDGRVFVSGQPLLLYHFQGLRVIRHWMFDLYAALRPLPRPVRDLIYRPYTAMLSVEMRAMARQAHNGRLGLDNYVGGLGGFLSAAKHFLLTRNIQFRPLAK